MAKKQSCDCPAGLPAWLVTFADLMSILVCFFVLIISFSIQDKEKLEVVAGSMRDAFGVKDVARKAGISRSQTDVQTLSSPTLPRMMFSTAMAVTPPLLLCFIPCCRQQGRHIGLPAWSGWVQLRHIGFPQAVQYATAGLEE